MGSRMGSRIGSERGSGAVRQSGVGGLVPADQEVRASFGGQWQGLQPPESYFNLSEKWLEKEVLKVWFAHKRHLKAASFVPCSFGDRGVMCETGSVVRAALCSTGTETKVWHERTRGCAPGAR